MNIDYIKGQIAKKPTDVLTQCYKSYSSLETKTVRESTYRDLLKEEIERRTSASLVA